MRERLMWIALGLLGLVLAATLGYATNRLTQPPIGLVSEPVSAGEALAPPRPPATTPPPTPEAPPTTTTSRPEEGSEDSSSGKRRGRGRGRGRGGDD